MAEKEHSTVPERVKRPIVLCLIAVSFVCNSLALYFPFVKLKQGLVSESYSILSTVEMLWAKGIHVLAILVLGFSVLFPFGKLSALLWLARKVRLSSTEAAWLAWVERLGKWSMLDVFLVSIVLSLASRQFIVAGEPLLGLSFFIVAITLNMLAGELLGRELLAEQESPAPEGESTGGILLALSGIALLAALFFPFLRIDDWLLIDREYSVFDLMLALWRQGAGLASVLVCAFLVTTPIISWLVSAEVWYSHRVGRSSRGLVDWYPLARRWSMLDVFALALVVFAIESDSLMKTELRLGALLLAIAVALQWGLSIGLVERIRKARPV